LRLTIAPNAGDKKDHFSSTNNKKIMSKIIFDSGMSLDGFFACNNRSPGNPIGDNGRIICHCKTTVTNQ